MLDNGFGLKFGGHFDALLTKTPSLIPVEDFYAVLWRELTQRMELPEEESLDAVTLRGLLLTTLKSLGMVIEEPVKESEKKEYFISPFSTQPQSFMTPHAIQKLLTESAKKNPSKVTDEEILTLSDYLSQLINRMQFNSGISLGIGANDDDTVSFSNEGRDYFFQFLQNESEWTNRFIQNSLHRQGPAQPHMNAAKGIQHELVAAFMTESKRIGELQRSEYEETIYNAIIDNLVTDLFSSSGFF